MASIPQTQIALNKQIRNNQILALVLLLGFAASVFYVIRTHNQSHEDNLKLQKANENLDKKNKELEKAYKDLADSKKIVLAKEEQDKAIQLLGVLLNDSNPDSTYTQEKILNNLTQLAKEKEEEIKKHHADITNAINQLFSNNETRRKAAQRSIIREYGDYKNIVKEMLVKAMEEENFRKNNSLYQVTYILTQLSNASLVKEKSLVEQFMQKMITSEKAGQSTQQDFATIRRKFTS